MFALVLCLLSCTFKLWKIRKDDLMSFSHVEQHSDLIFIKVATMKEKT